MIGPGMIHELLDKEPFEPFRIQMNNGQQYDVATPSLAAAMESTSFLATPNRGRLELLS